MRSNSNLNSLAAARTNANTDLFETYNEVLSSMEQGIIVWSDEGVCTLVNRRYFEITGSTETELFIGQSWDEHMGKRKQQGRYTQQQIESIEQRMQAKEIFTVERTAENGSTISVSIRPLMSGGQVVSLTDITASKRHEESLAQALERAEGAEAKAHLTLSTQQLRQTEIDKLSEFGDWLHTCKTLEELYEIVSQAMQNIYKGSSGQLFIYSNSRDVLDGVCCWGNSEIQYNVQAQDCWSLRRGRVFHFGDGMIQLDCHHVDETLKNTRRSYYCLPLIAHGDTVGLLHLDVSNMALNTVSAENKEFKQAFATRCAEQISLAVANAKLRDELHEQSTRDPLTGLFNRRYFMERCRSEIARAEKNDARLGIAVFDADNFKKFNDHHGHDAGDTVLCQLSHLAHQFFIDDDVVARIGGEEFAILSPHTETKEFHERLEKFRQLISQLTIKYANGTLPTATVSIGYSVYPDHGSRLSDLIKLADNAMYRSKDRGKDCVTEATPKS